MVTQPRLPVSDLSPEKLAYWYFRLNGFLQTENFVVHPERRGGQRTDADLLGVRFRHRLEFAFDRAATMIDDERLKISRKYDDVVIVEVKTNQPCTLNGPWTKSEKIRNVHRVLAAIGCIPILFIDEAAKCIYDDGIAIFGRTRIRLVAIGRNKNPELAERYNDVLQLTWREVIQFIWGRFSAYREQKRNVEQWDESGRELQSLSATSDLAGFTAKIGRIIGLTALD